MKLHTTPFLTVLVLLGSCGGGEAPAPEASNGTAPAPGMPAALWSKTPLEGAIDVKDARESKADGDAVVLRGTLQQFGQLATFRLVEDSLDDCTEMGEEDHCATPWDYCCEDPDKLETWTVNVEFMDGEFPADWSLEGQHGLELLSEVTVAGTLRVDDAGNLRLEAERMAMQ